MLSIAVMVNSAWFLAGSALLLLLLDRVVVRREERAIRDAFGPDSQAYASRVRRWL